MRIKKGITFFILIIEIGFVYGQNDFSFVFLPDQHLHPDSVVEINFNMIEKQISALNPDFIITGGDMIYTAKNGNERKAKVLFDFMDAKIRQFKIPVYHTLGNHEIVGILPESGIDPSHPQWGKQMFEELYGYRYKSFVINGWKFFLLDGVKILEKEKNYTQEVDSIQMNWLLTELSETDKNEPLVISIHTPLVNPKAMTDSNTPALSTNAQSVLELFNGYNLKMVLQGHNHLYMNLFIHGIHFISGGSTSFGPELNSFDDGFILVRVKKNVENIEFIHTERQTDKHK